jgi:hypothetical protein
MDARERAMAIKQRRQYDGDKETGCQTVASRGSDAPKGTIVQSRNSAAPTESARRQQLPLLSSFAQVFRPQARQIASQVRYTGLQNSGKAVNSVGLWILFPLLKASNSFPAQTGHLGQLTEAEAIPLPYLPQTT